MKQNTFATIKEQLKYLLKELICADDPVDIDELEAATYKLIENHEEILIEIIQDDSQLGNVRATAAKLLFAVGDKIGIFENQALIDKIDSILKHESDLIRYGIVIGLGVAENREKLEKYLEDSNSDIREEATDLLVKITIPYIEDLAINYKRVL